MPKRAVETTRERIVKAAIDIFYNTDLDKAGIRKVAQRAGVSTRCIYRYFPSKEHLLASVANEKMKQIVIGLKEHLSGMRGTLNKLSKMTNYYLAAFEKDRQTAWLINVSANPTIWRRYPEGWKTLEETAELFKNIVLEGQATGEVRSDIYIEAVSGLYFGGLRNLVTWWLVNQRTWSLASASDKLAETLFDAIKTHDEASTPFVCPFAAVAKSPAFNTDKACQPPGN